jgi:hypothetical protein
VATVGDLWSDLHKRGSSLRQAIERLKKRASETRQP